MTVTLVDFIPPCEPSHLALGIMGRVFGENVQILLLYLYHICLDENALKHRNNRLQSIVTMNIYGIQGYYTPRIFTRFCKQIPTKDEAYLHRHICNGPLKSVTILVR
jgi:hypothetical protein